MPTISRISSNRTEDYRERRERESRREVSRLEEDGMVFESAINNNWTRIKI